MDNGNVLIIFSIFIAIFLIILLLILAIFMSHVNNVLYNIKLDVYSMAKSGIIAVNKNKANTGHLSYDIKTYKKELEKIIKHNYELNEDMSNDEKLISKIDIEEYTIYAKGQRDAYTRNKCNDVTLHIVMNVKIRPIILKSFFEKIFIFQIHEDVNMNLVKM